MKLWHAAFTFLAVSSIASAANFVPGNIVFSRAGFSGPHRLEEYTRNGVLVQSVAVPVLSTDSFEYNRGVCLDQYGRANVFNGSFEARVSTFDPSLGTWTTWNEPDISVFANMTFGKIASYGDYVFLSDMESTSSPDEGIVRLNVIDGTWVRFAAPKSDGDTAIDLTIGPDGKLYTFIGPFSISRIEAFDPDSLQLLETIDIPAETMTTIGSARDVAVDEQGRFYLNGGGTLFQLSHSGEILDSQDYGFGPLDMSRSSDGDFLISSADNVAIINSEMNLTHSFGIAAEFTNSTFGSMVMAPVPEPGAVLLISASLVCFLRKNRIKN